MKSKHHALVAACKGGRRDDEAQLPEIVHDAPSRVMDGEEEAA